MEIGIRYLKSTLKNFNHSYELTINYSYLNNIFPEEIEKVISFFLKKEKFLLESWYFMEYHINIDDPYNLYPDKESPESLKISIYVKKELSKKRLLLISKKISSFVLNKKMFLSFELFNYI